MISNDLKTAASRVEWWSWTLAECYAAADARDEALDWLENAVRRGFIAYPFLSRGGVSFGRFRGDSRYDALIATVKDTWERCGYA